MSSSKLVADFSYVNHLETKLASCAYSSADRASVFGTEGRGFESHRARQ